jgi:hypothetical protein
MITRSFTKKTLTNTQDTMTIHMVYDYIQHFNKNIKFVENMNTRLKSKTIRQSNFPSEISENIVKFAYSKRYGKMPTWDTDKGDLSVRCDNLSKRLEVKGSLDLFGGGPSSFGPTEQWDSLFFVDAKRTLDKWFTVYEICVPSDSDDWKNIKVNSNQTYVDQCLQGKRPRIMFQKIVDQLSEQDCSIIFDGVIHDLY